MISNDFYGLKPLPVLPVNQRPKCPQCGKVRSIQIDRADISWELRRQGKRGAAIGWRYAYPISGHFCTLRCANDYANKIIDNNL
jgi:hypothetical protein